MGVHLLLADRQLAPAKVQAGSVHLSSARRTRSRPILILYVTLAAVIVFTYMHEYVRCSYLPAASSVQNE